MREIELQGAVGQDRLTACLARQRDGRRREPQVAADHLALGATRQLVATLPVRGVQAHDPDMDVKRPQSVELAPAQRASGPK